MSSPGPLSVVLVDRCLSLLASAGQPPWSKQGKQIIEVEVRQAAAAQNGGLLGAAFELIALIGQLVSSSPDAARAGPAEALETAARDLSQPLDRHGAGRLSSLSCFSQGLLEEVVTALVQAAGLLKTKAKVASAVPPKDPDPEQRAAILVAVLQQLRRQLVAEPEWRVPASLGARSRAVLLGSPEQRAAKHNPLPSQSATFRGRDALLTSMHNSFASVPSPGRRLLLVRSKRGMGKTQLVLAYVLRHLTQYDKVLWLSASTPAWRVRYLQLAGYVGVDLTAQASWEERAAQVRAGIQAYPGRLLLVLDGLDDSTDITTLVPREEKAVLHIIVTTSAPDLRLDTSHQLEVPELSDGHAMALLRGSEEAGSAASEANLAAAAAAFKDLTLTVAVAACLFREGAALPAALLDNADPLGLQTQRKRSEGSGQFWLGRCCYEALRFLEESGKEKALLAATSALVGGWFGPGGISLELLVSGVQWHIGSRVLSTKVEAALVELSRLGIAARQGDGAIVFPSVLRNYVAADKKRGGHHAMLRALASAACDWTNSDHFRAVWHRRIELADSYARKQLVLHIGLKTAHFFVEASGEYPAAEALCGQALAWLGKDEPTWRWEFTAAHAQALAAHRKYSAATAVWQAEMQAGEPADEEDKFMPKNFRAGVRPLPLDLSRAADPLGAPAESPQKAASPESPASPDGSLDVFHAALPNLRTTPLHDAPDKANSLAHSDAGSTPKSALSIVSAFGMPRKRLQRGGSAKAERRSVSPGMLLHPGTFQDSLRRSTSTPPGRPTPPRTPRSVSPHLTRLGSLKNGSPEAVVEVLRQESDTLLRATPLPARPASAYQHRRKSWSPSLRTSLEHEARELVSGRVPEAMLGQAAATACQGDLPAALALLAQARDHPAAQEGGHLPAVLTQQGALQAAGGQQEAALRSLQEAVEAGEKGAGQEAGRRSQPLVAYADVLLEAGRPQQAGLLYQAAAELLAKEHGAASLVVLEVQQRQAVAALRGGQVRAAVELLEAGRTAKQALLLPSSPARATGLEALTEAYAAQGRLDDALACWEEAAKIQAAVLPARSPALARLLLLGAGLYQAKGRKKEAADWVKRALAIEDSIQPPGAPHLAISLAQAANVVRAQKRYDEALALAQRSVAQQGRAASGNPLDVALCLDALASTHMCRKRYEEAQPLFNRALTIHDETNTANKATADLLTNMAECADLQGRNDKAQPLLERALGIYETLGVREDDPTFVKSKKKLASFKWQRQLSGFCCTSPKTK